jgi:hypothetical protein
MLENSGNYMLMYKWTALIVVKVRGALVDFSHITS